MKMNLFQLTSSYRTKLILSVYNKWIKKGDKLIDIGCGTGIVIKQLGEYFSSEIAGCDVKNYLMYKIPFIKIANNHIPIKDHNYNIALLNDVLHHINKEQQEQVIKEAMRVAHKLLIFEFEPTVISKISDIILNKLHYGDLTDPLALRPKEEWEKLFKKMNFKFKAVKLKKPFWYPFSHIAFILTRK